jgi:hypothetical protein
MFWSKPKCKGSAEAAKHPTTTTTSPANIISSAPPHRHQKKQPTIAPPNKDKWPDKQTQPLKSFCDPLDAQSQDGLSSRPWLSFKAKFPNTIFLTEALEVSYSYRTWLKGNCATFPSQLCLPCPSSQFKLCTQFLTQFNLLTTTAFIAPGLSFQGQTIQLTNFILYLHEKASPLAMQSHPPLRPWPSCSPVAGKANQQLRQPSLPSSLF